MGFRVPRLLGSILRVKGYVSLAGMCRGLAGGRGVGARVPKAAGTFRVSAFAVRGSA